MLTRLSISTVALVLGTAAGALVACGGGDGPSGSGGFSNTTGSMGAGAGSATGGGGSSNGPGSFVGAGAGTGTSAGGGGGNQQGLLVTPKSLQVITVAAGTQNPTATWHAEYDGHPINAGWSVDRGDIGTMPGSASADGVFTPSGNVGGYVDVSAGLKVGTQTLTAKRQVLVKLTSTQNGPNGSAAEQRQIAMTPGDLTAGGGVGGVGGEGLGGAVTDMPTLTALGSPADDGSALGLTWLYPYDATVFPRGILAPLLMWDWSVGDADAIQIDLATKSGSFTYSGTFSKPPILMQTGGKFIRMPIPQDAWDQATNSAGATLPDGTQDTLTLKLTVASGGVAHGPITRTLTIAPARLSGIIYYNSYGTQLAKNYGGAVGGDHQFGGAVLSIHVGDTGPQLVAGSNGGTAQCRVCHSVASSGSRLVVQHGDNYGATSSYDLSATPPAEKALINSSTEFPGVYPDGSLALSPAGQILPMPDAASPTTPSGLAAVATNLGTPAFAPDGKAVAFNAMAGPGVTAPKKQLLVMSYDLMSNTFSNPVVVVDDAAAAAETRPGWPAFTPDGKSVVFHHQSAAGSDGNGMGALATRKGAKAQIAVTSVNDAMHVAPLDQLNGKGYLPKLATPITMSCTGDGVQVGGIDPDHGDDVDVNYEPTVNPVASGGYAWVVFTSRRMYGSVADIPPFCSDPRGVDLVQNITPKKLWVAAIDLNAPAGTDPSHPAFYLPGQELLAGNARGYWVLDPCKMDGDSCESGDQCCNGFCEPNGNGGALVCSNMPNNGMCSGTQEHCDTSSDCCDPQQKCINGFCSIQTPH
ncbi:MAG TPA: hypothetical protein VHB21_16115 [Minicystis sp.]|nr:hypothetical protein [Minicystis sp.]